MLAIIYLNHQDLYGTKGNPRTLKKKLRKLGRASMLSNLAVVNNLYAHAEFLGKGYKDFPAIQDLLKGTYLRPEVRQRIEDEGLSDRFVFSRLQNLYLAQLAVLNCDDRRPVIVDGGTPGGFDLGDCCIISGDCLYSAAEERNTSTGSDEKRIRHLGFQLGPGGEISNPLDMLRGIVRSEIIYSDLLNSNELAAVAGEDTVAKLDIADRFRRTTGMDIAEYIDIVVAILSYLLVPDEKTGLGHIRSIEVEAFLAQSKLRRAALENFLKLESSTVDELAKRFRTQPKYLKQFSFLPFKSHPIIQIQAGLYFCIDSFFLSEKLNAGLYWKIFDTLPGKLRDTFSRVYGHVFELYVRRLLQWVLVESRQDAKKGILFSEPRYENGDCSFDEVIYYPETKHLIVIESKASFMKTPAKYGKSIKAFWSEIRQKFIEKANGEPKGIGQLVKHIGNLFSADRSSRRKLTESELDQRFRVAEKISPVLIVQEPVLSFHINESLLNREFQRLLRKQKLRAGVVVQNLTVLNIETLEWLRPHLADREATLEQCINFRTYRDREHKHDFGTLVASNFDLKNRTDEETNSVYSAVFKRATGRFFSSES